MEDLNEWAQYAGQDRPDREWLLHPCDVWVVNPWYDGPPQPHPEDYDPDDERHFDLVVAWEADQEGRTAEANVIRDRLSFRPIDRPRDPNDDLPF